MTDIIKNPFNYHGSKNRIMPLIKENLPEKLDFVVDIFGGSGEVCLNIGKKCLYNDKDKYIFNLIKTIKECDIENIISTIEANIDYYRLTKTSKTSFLNIRKDFNTNGYQFLECEVDSMRHGANLMLLTMLYYSFNYQLTFNSQGKYSNPSGYNRSSFNKSLREKLIKYKQQLDKIDMQMWNYDFLTCYQNFIDFYPNYFKEDMLFFVDPPYFNTDDTYSRTYGMKWTESDERHLYDVLNDINKRGGKFMLTNTVINNGVKNEYLDVFSKKYNTISTDCDFNGCSYQRKNKKTREIIVKNY